MSELAAFAAVVAITIGGCSEPLLSEGPAEEAGSDTPPADADAGQQGHDELAAAVAELHEALAAARDHLRTAADADSIEEARAEADRALGRLLVGAGSGAGPAVLPAETPEREAMGELDDLLNATLTRARDVGGDPGTAVVELLRDEVAGDLGAWERDAEGVAAAVARTAASPGDLDELTDDILEHPGEATRALAWTLVATEARDLDAATTAASRAASHLELATLALEELRTTLPGNAAVTDQ